MPKSSRHGESPLLHTATAITDPILARLDSLNAKRTTVLLAEDVTYDHADTITLHRVRWSQVKSRRPFLFSILREPAVGSCDELHLQKAGTRWFAHVDKTPGTLATAPNAELPLIQLTMDQHQILHTASPRRLQLAAQSFFHSLPKSRPATRLHRTLAAVKSATRSLLHLQPTS